MHLTNNYLISGIIVILVLVLIIVRGSFTRYKQRKLAVAKIDLQKLQDQIVGHSRRKDVIVRGIEDRFFTFEQLGTTQEKINVLADKLTAKERAIAILGYLRSYDQPQRGVWFSRRDISYVYEEMNSIPGLLKVAGITLESLGSSDKEFASFPHRIAVHEARMKWAAVIENIRLTLRSFSELQELIQDKDLIPDDFGVTEVQFDSVRRGLTIIWSEVEDELETRSERRG